MGAYSCLCSSRVGSASRGRRPATRTCSTCCATRCTPARTYSVFGRTGVRTSIVDGRARKTVGHKKAKEAWSVLIRDHHPGYITWAEYEKNQIMLDENAHRKKGTGRKSGRGGRALLTGLVRCGRCARMMRVCYERKAGHSHRYQCGSDYMKANGKHCIGVGGVRVDRAIISQLLEAVAPHAVDAALEAAARAARLVHGGAASLAEASSLPSLDGRPP